MEDYLTATPFFNFHHPAIQALSQKITGDTDIERAISIYYLVRDNIRYNPYTLRDGMDSLKASYCLQHNQAYCIPKSALMIALCRQQGIPARLGLADVINHLSSTRLVEWLGTDYFAMHGYAEIWLNQKWVKATPVFNKELCDKFNVDPLDFDGIHHSVLQDSARDGSKHMEYVKDHGTFADIPVKLIFDTIAEIYPHFAMQFSRFNDNNRFDDNKSLEDDLKSEAS